MGFDENKPLGKWMDENDGLAGLHGIYYRLYLNFLPSFRSGFTTKKLAYLLITDVSLSKEV